MLIYRRTSLLEAPSQTLVNTVNCVGVMGKGLAKAFKQREPKMFEVYKKICAEKRLEPGKLWLWKSSGNWILNFPTKIHWRNPSRLEWVEAGLQKFVLGYKEHGINEISFPRLGCGNGGLDWDDVRPLMENYLRDLPIRVYIHDYSVDVGLPEHLEAISRDLHESVGDDLSFPGFLKTLHVALDKCGGKMQDLGSHDAFSAKFLNDDLLRVSSKDGEWEFDSDDLRGIWLGLLRGLLTEDKANLAQRGSGTHMVSLLGILPHARAIQIQRAGNPTPEIALELASKSSKPATASEQSKQGQFAWR